MPTVLAVTKSFLILGALSLHTTPGTYKKNPSKRLFFRSMIIEYDFVNLSSKFLRILEWIRYRVKRKKIISKNLERGAGGAKI